MSKGLGIAVLVKTDSDWHRSVLAGVAQYSEDVGGWQFTIPPADANGEVRLPADWQGDGIICRITSPAQEQAIVECGKPAINISWLKCSTDAIARVISSEVGCARLAARFLLEKQYDQFGYIGFPPWRKYSDTFEEAFAAELSVRGCSLNSFQLTEHARENYGVDTNQLAAWLERLPKPIAVVVWDSVVGHVLVNACLAGGIDVPNAVAILCIEHDSLWSSLAPIPISNVDQDPWRVGYHAAKMLHQKIRGQSDLPDTMLIDPISVVSRKSTDASSVKDPVLDKALKFVYEQAKTGITVKDILQHVDMSRRALETKFKIELDCSPAAFIRRIQLQNVARLLRTTKLTIAAIAERTGFAYPEVLMRSFKREFGVTPMQFRGAGSAKNRPLKGQT